MMDGWYGYWHDTMTRPQYEWHVPAEERCWKCDRRRLHDGCHAGLCRECCEALKDVAA